MPYIGKSSDGFGIRERFTYLASAGDTTLSGSDSSNRTLTFNDPEYVDVFLNGVRLKNGTDFNLSTVNTVAGLTALAANDELEVIVHDIFSFADTVSSANGGTFSNNLIVKGNLSVTKDAAVLNFGADSDVSLTHVADTGLLLNSTRKIQFGDSATFIHQSADSVLTIDGEATIDLNASTAVLVSNDLKLNSDAAILGFGADNDVTLTHVADTGILLNGTSVIQFNDASQNIGAPSNAILDINATDEIEINATLCDVNANLDVSGTIVGASTLSATTITASTAFVPNASDGAALGTTALEFSDLFLADAAVISLGDDQDVTLTHVADTGLLLNTTMVVQFRDSAINIGSPADGDLDINADDEIELNSTLIDINGNVEISGTAVTTGVHTFTAVPVFPNNTVELADIQADAVDGTKIADNAINSEHYTDGSIDTAHIAADQIVASLIADNAIDSEHYTDGSIDTAHIAADQIVASLIADDAINSEHYTDGSIDTAHIAADQITNAKIADDQIDSEHYVDGSIDTAHIAADQIVASLIADDAINSEHYTDGSIDTAHIADGQITIGKLATAVLTGATDIGAAIVDADLLLVDDGAGGTLRKTAASRLKTYIGGGITGADTWRVNASFQGDVCPISSNWERQDTDSPGYIGTAMAVSSGIWTFPTTGIWEITFNHNISGAGDNHYVESRIEATANNGTAWSNASKAWQAVPGNGLYGMSQCKMLFDVTNVSNDKIRICTDSQDTDAHTQAATDQNLTYVIFVRLGDT